MTRIDPVTEPYEPDIATQLEAMMPPGVPPIGLFRTMVRNLPMTRAMHGWGSYELSKNLSLSLRDREIAIDRTCALCRCEYEWGAHVSYFADRAGLTREQVASLTHGTSDDECWTSDRDRLLIRATDSLHRSADVRDELWNELTSVFSHAELLDLLMLCGWYHAIAYTANAARVACEDGAPRFGDYS